MVAQRGSGVAHRTEPKTKTERPGKERPRAEASKRKMNFSDKHALEKLPKQLAELDRKIADLQQRLSNPDLYARDPGKFSELSQSLARAQHEHAEGEQRWLELEMQREELESE
jgi:ATP-binding cassette subfamily F protein uup